MFAPLAPQEPSQPQTPQPALPVPWDRFLLRLQVPVAVVMRGITRLGAPHAYNVHLAATPQAIGPQSAHHAILDHSHPLDRHHARYAQPNSWS